MSSAQQQIGSRLSPNFLRVLQLMLFDVGPYLFRDLYCDREQTSVEGSSTRASCPRFRFTVSPAADSRGVVVAVSPCLVVAEFPVEVAVVLVCLVCQS
jgi:hypothetical protein